MPLARSPVLLCPYARSCLPHMGFLVMQMTRRCPQGDVRPLAIASKRGPGVCQTTVLLLACAFIALHNTAVEGRSFAASRPYTFRRLQSVNLPADDPGWTLGRASYSNPSEGFNNTFVPGLR